MRPSPEAAAAQPAARRSRVGLVVDNMDWHARALSRALVALGATPTPIRLTACGFATSSRTGLAIDGLGTALPDAIVVRSMSAGSFEAVTLRLRVLPSAPRLRVLVWDHRPPNHARAPQADAT